DLRWRPLHMPITRPSRRDCREPAARRAWFATLLLFAAPACRNAPQAPADARSVRNQEENADRAPDPLATEIQRWSTWREREPSQHESFVQVKQATAPLLAIARQAVESDHRLAAAYRVAQASPNMAGIMFQLAHAQPDQAALAAEWQRVGAELQADRTAIEPAVLADIGPAA